MSDQYQQPSPFPGSGFPAQGSTFPSQQPSGSYGAAGFPQSFGGPAPRPAAPEPAPAKRGKGKRGKEPKDAKPPTKRLVSRQLVLAGVFAAVVGVVAWVYMSGDSNSVYVVRAKADIAVGSHVTPDLLEAVLLPKSAVEPNTYSAADGKAALDAATKGLGSVVAQYPLVAKSQVRSDEFGVQTTLGQALAPTDRLVSIRASVSGAVSGKLSVGDRVDIIGTGDNWSKVVAYNVPIVSISASQDAYNSVADQQSANRDVHPSDALPGDPVPGIYVVKVPAEQVTALLNWNASGTLNLAYRPANATDATSPDDYLTPAAANQAKG